MVLLIIAILAAMSAPVMSSLGQKNRVSTMTSDIKRKLLFARNHSSNTLNYVTVCPLVGNDCSSDWTTGVDVFIDLDKNKKVNGFDEILNEGNAIHSGDKLVSTFTNGITFTPEGQVNDTITGIAFRYCTSGQRAAIALALNGHPKLLSRDAFTDCN